MDKQESYDKTSAYDEGYTEGSNTTYERMKGDPEKDWDTGYEYGLSKGFDKGWNAATAGHTAAKEASYDEGYDTAMTNFEADQRFIDAGDVAYGNGYTCGIHNSLTEFHAELIELIGDGKVDYVSIIVAMNKVRNDHPWMNS